MKSKKFFKKALSVMMAALVSASTVFPVYAADLDGVEPVTETDASQTDSEGNETEAQQTEASVGQWFTYIAPRRFLCFGGRMSD